jgi:hypothetical protein
VPSTVGSGAQSQTVDCRPLADTNGDGKIDSQDTCVPVGGFINGIRPVNLAKDLIADAQSGTSYVSPYQQNNGTQATPVGGTFDTSNISFTNITFSTAVTSNDQPVDTVVSFPSAPQNVCAFWDYSGMQDGMSWDADWYLDGTLDKQGSIIGNTWAGGDSGNWWVCVTDQKGLPDGADEVILQVEGNPQAASALYAGNAHKIVDLNIDNQGSNEICQAAISPLKAQNWGGDKLGSGVTIPARLISHVEGGHRRLRHTDAGLLRKHNPPGHSVSITKSSTYTVTDQTPTPS